MTELDTYQLANEIEIRRAADVLETLSSVSRRVDCTILDPWYNKGVGGFREDYDQWLNEVILEAAKISDHIFVWGFPEIIAYQVSKIPKSHRLVAWLTWYYKNCPSVIRGWRSAQNTCLHLAREDAKTYPEHFLSDVQLEKLRAGKMRFVPGPPSVIEAPLNVGFVGKDEQTGHPAQKPLSVIEPLILMSTKMNGLVLDPMCGSGTTGEASLRLGRRAILCDESEEWLKVTSDRIKRISSDSKTGIRQHEFLI